VRALLAFALAATACTAPPPAPTPSKLATPAPKPKPEFSTVPFDLTRPDVPPDYPGHDLDALVKNLQESNTEKGEFETTNQYRERLATEAAKPLLGDVGVGDLVAFVLTDTLVGARYDADTELFLVTVKTEYAYEGYNKLTDSHAICGAPYLVKRGRLDPNSPPNSVAISAYACLWLGKNISIGGKNTQLGSAPLELHVPVPRAAAPSVKGNLRVLVVGRVTSLSLREGVNSFKVTTPAPVEAGFFYFYPDFSPVELRVYDNTTGVVYYRASVTRVEGSTAGPQRPTRSPAPRAPRPAVPTSAPKPTAMPQYWIQTGATTRPDQAEGIRQRVMALGFRADQALVLAGTSGKYRVRLGPFPDQDSAARVAARLQESGFPDAFPLKD